MPPRLLAAFRLASVFLSALALAGCPVIFPELGTRTRALPAGQPLDPPPPEAIRWLRVLSARVPEKSRSGRPWQTNGKLADPYAKISINGNEIFRTAVQRNTLEPTWPDGPKGNFQLASDDRLRVELWDANPLNDRPICVQDIDHIDEEQLIEKQLRVSCDGGAEVVLAFEKAHAILGAGLWYELRIDTCFVTRLLHGSPAERAGLRAGDQLLEINGRKVQEASSDGIRSAFNAIPVGGLNLTIKHADGSSLSINLQEGAIYPLYDQFGPVD